MSTRPHAVGPSPIALAVAGSAAVATAFGMARYGYGLLLPDIKSDLGLSAAVLGVIGTLSYVSYIAAAGFVAGAVEAFGARAVVIVGGLFAVAGTLIVAAADGPVVLAAGISVAGVSAGLVYPPFADAVAALPEASRGRTLAIINSGTGWGVAIAAPLAIAAGEAWRPAYVGFAACAVLSTAVAARTLPPRGERTTKGPSEPAWRRDALPLVAGAFLVGLGSAAFWTFGVDAARAGGLGVTAARGLLGTAGIASLLGMGAADLIDRLGARRTFVACALLEAAAIATVAVAAGDLVAVLAAGAAFGAAYNTIVAVSVLWSQRLYADLPTAGVAVAAGGNAAGLLCGPAAGGVLADAVGLTAALLGGAAVVLLAVAFAPR